MTSRVGSRFYRTPELILCQEDYDCSIDIWSVGCVLGELLLNFIEKDNDVDKLKGNNM